MSYGEMFDSPEELCECFIDETVYTPQEQDQIYLLIFELWRKLFFHKPCLSIFCDELDHQIHCYDEGKPNFEALQNVLSYLQTFIENAHDNGENSKKIMQAIESQCANHLESFLYDYIAKQIELGQIDYAQELLDAFDHLMVDQKWFVFLRIRVLTYTDSQIANDVLTDLIYSTSKDQDIEFNLQLLDFLSGFGDPQLFVYLVTHTFPLIETESDLQEILSLCGNYYARLDYDEKEKTIVQLIQERQSIPYDTPIDKQDLTVQGLIEYLQNS